ncbi:endonuclease/exonuclease/phosphatase family protein [Bacillus niameyensis]|uniref:endonuclease/exonuclease/phosphatase family protein n=1 Tax=Bacillus niameyensis TaxID=1522308 RepID=UPI000784888D|nr:endonuclease/exonuclease/phosphatase family protein [Bacillus niameyensis]
MKIMSYNIHHGEGLDEVLSLERIAKIIRDEKATIVGLQEVDRNFGERSDFQDQAKELAKLLDYHYVYAANIDIAHTDGQAENQQYGNAILSMYPIKDSENIPLTSYEDEPRGLLRALIDVCGTQLHVFNTHLSLESRSKREQVKEIVEWTKNFEGSKVLIGDFNSEPDSEEIQALLGKSDLIDCFEDIADNASYPSDNPEIRIDYIFASRQLEILNQSALMREGSDHLPIIAEMKFRR